MVRLPSCPRSAWVRTAVSPDSRRVVVGGFDGTTRLWELRADPRPAADLLLWAELLAGAHIDERIGMVPVSGSAVQPTWPGLRAKYPEDFTVTAQDILSWHQREAEICETGRQWSAARHHLDRLLTAEPANAALCLRRGRVQAELACWDGARADFDRGIELGAGSELVWQEKARACLGGGDQEGYRQACAALLKRLGETEAPVLANNLAWVCALTPNTGADPAQLLRLAEKAVARQPRASTFRNTLGAILYRAGRFANAVQCLNEAITLQGQGGTAFDWLLLAMAHQQLGHAAEARQWLDKARTEKSAASDPPPPWSQRLELQLLRHEAESLIK